MRQAIRRPRNTACHHRKGRMTHGVQELCSARLCSAHLSAGGGKRSENSGCTSSAQLDDRPSSGPRRQTHDAARASRQGATWLRSPSLQAWSEPDESGGLRLVVLHNPSAQYRFLGSACPGLMTSSSRPRYLRRAPAVSPQPWSGQPRRHRVLAVDAARLLSPAPASASGRGSSGNGPVWRERLGADGLGQRVQSAGVGPARHQAVEISPGPDEALGQQQRSTAVKSRLRFGGEAGRPVGVGIDRHQGRVHESAFDAVHEVQPEKVEFLADFPELADGLALVDWGFGDVDFLA